MSKVCGTTLEPLATQPLVHCSSPIVDSNEQ